MMEQIAASTWRDAIEDAVEMAMKELAENGGGATTSPLTPSAPVQGMDLAPEQGSSAVLAPEQGSLKDREDPLLPGPAELHGPLVTGSGVPRGGDLPEVRPREVVSALKGAQQASLESLGGASMPRSSMPGSRLESRRVSAWKLAAGRLSSTLARVRSVDSGGSKRPPELDATSFNQSLQQEPQVGEGYADGLMVEAHDFLGMQWRSPCYSSFVSVAGPSNPWPLGPWDLSSSRSWNLGWTLGDADDLWLHDQSKSGAELALWSSWIRGGSCSSCTEGISLEIYVGSPEGWVQTGSRERLASACGLTTMLLRFLNQMKLRRYGVSSSWSRRLTRSSRRDLSSPTKMTA